jgi:hypothetical protein
MLVDKGTGLQIVCNTVQRNLFFFAPKYKGVCTHTGKTGAESDSGAGCNVNKWAYSHAAGPRRPRPIAGPAS